MNERSHAPPTRGPQALTATERESIVAQARAGAAPDALLAPLLERGWSEQEAIDAVEAVVRVHLEEHARANALPVPTRVPAPFGTNGPAVLDAGDREVHVLASLLLPRVVVLGGLLAVEECDEFVALARDSLSRSRVYDPDTGEDRIHAARTSESTCFQRGANALCERIERRIARLLDWPLENGEGLQVLRYGVGAQYEPHHDWFDPSAPGSRPTLARGGQRVATVVMYLNTPLRGGATVFPEARFEAAAVKGNAVFFCYDRPHPMTRTLHGGAPVLDGEKWIATKWLRENAHV